MAGMAGMGLMMGQSETGGAAPAGEPAAGREPEPITIVKSLGPSGGAAGGLALKVPRLGRSKKPVAPREASRAGAAGEAKWGAAGGGVTGAGGKMPPSGSACRGRADGVPRISVRPRFAPAEFGGGGGADFLA